MSQFPSLPLYIDAWVADTAYLTRAERGLYHDLLVLMWSIPECRVPNDLEWIGRRLRCTADELPSLKLIIQEFCQSTGNWITQKRLKKEYESVRNRVAKRREAANARWENHEVDAVRKLDPEKACVPGKSLIDNVTGECKSTASISISISKESSPSSSGGVEGKPNDEFERFHATLLSIEGISKHPVSTEAGCAPMWGLRNQGYDLHTVIVPSIKQQLARVRSPIASWSYFVKGILRYAKEASGVGVAPAADTGEWEKRLTLARERKVWAYQSWGPMPGKQGCRAPAALLRPGDGEGWGEWRPDAA